MSENVKFLNILRPWAAILCCWALLLPPVDARTKIGDKLLKRGEKAELQHDYDAALTDFQQALETDSKEAAYLIAEQRVRPMASNTHVENGKKLLQQQKLDEALVQFNKALLTDPSSMIALQMIQQTNEMIKARNKAPAGTVILTPGEQAHRDLEKRIESLEGPPTLRPITNQISSLKMNNQTSRVLYESVGKLAGINVLFDPQGIEGMGVGGGGGGGGSSRNFNLDLTNVTLEEALNYVALVTHTFWKPISRNAIFVTSESEQKRQEYQDEVVRVFHVQNASSANEFTEIFNGVRTGAKLTTGVFQVASQNAIIVRGSPDTMSIVEKLVHDLDRPKAEILVDVLVLEVSKSNVLNLGAALTGTAGGSAVTGLGLTISPGTSTTSTTSGTATTATTGTSIPLSGAGKLSTNQFSVNLPGALIEAFLSDSSTRLLQRPEVRVTDGGKSTLKIGSKIPYVSGSLNSAVATPGSIPYATTQFQQIDVGVNIDLQPHVNGPEDVSMHIKVEVSQVTSTETIAGVQQPIISQRVNEADLRMKDGEASLLGGLTSDSDTQSAAGLPGVTNIPILGYLFGTHTRDKEKDDIVIALVPHIIRAPVVDLSDQGVLAGTERVVKVERRPDGGANGPVQSQPVQNQPVQNQPVQNQPVAPVPSIPPARTTPPTPTPPAQLPPLGKALDLPPGLVPGQTTASRASVLDGIPPVIQHNPATSYAAQAPGRQPQSSPFAPFTRQRDGSAGPQPAPDPNTAGGAASTGGVASPVKPISSNKKPKAPAIDPNAPLELTSDVVSDSQSPPK
jgi:general secretion pathway protein D